MKSLYYLAFVTLFATQLSCKRSVTVLDFAYRSYLKAHWHDEKVKAVTREIAFWNARLMSDTGNFVDMAGRASQEQLLFELTGDIGALRRADSLLRASSAKLNDSDPDLLYSLVKTSIQLHEFRRAPGYLEKARKARGDEHTIRMLQFDVMMELGYYREAFNSLQSVVARDGFDYLVRRAKWEDHQGNLEGALLLMENARDMIKGKNEDLFSWVNSNLGDMYGHAGRIEDSYKAYLEVLAGDPANLHCLKGIAWIAFSNDSNTEVAREILGFILSRSVSPDLKMMMCELADFENNKAEKEKWLKEFLAEAQAPAYGNMYNKYLIEYYAVENDQLQKALAIAELELENRLTPETSSWMASVLLKLGEEERAFRWAVDHIEDQTYEPEVILTLAHIYRANGREEKAKALFKSCLESGYELGPLVSREIRQQLATP